MSKGGIFTIYLVSILAAYDLARRTINKFKTMKMNFKYEDYSGGFEFDI